MFDIKNLILKDLSCGIMDIHDFYKDYFAIESEHDLRKRLPLLYIGGEDRLFLVYKKDGKIISHLTLKIFEQDLGYGRIEDGWHLIMMAIGTDENHRNQGYASSLMKNYFQIIRHNQHQKIVANHSHWEPDGKKYLAPLWERMKNPIFKKNSSI